MITTHLDKDAYLDKLRKKRNLFSSLETLDDFMTLDKITVVNGLLDMKLSEQLSFNFDKVM